jgi:large subunit ribosomal protein L33
VGAAWIGGTSLSDQAFSGSRALPKFLGSIQCHDGLAITRQARQPRAIDELPIMAKKAKSRLINVRLISMAMTGFFYTFKRPRTSPLMGLMKYDPIIRKRVLFLETKKRSK